MWAHRVSIKEPPPVYNLAAVYFMNKLTGGKPGVWDGNYKKKSEDRLLKF